MHHRIAELGRHLQAVTDDQLDKPTQADRDYMMNIRRQVKDLEEDPEITGNPDHETDRAYLYMEATKMANRQEDFYENNGNKWAGEPVTEEPGKLVELTGADIPAHFRPGWKPPGYPFK